MMIIGIGGTTERAIRRRGELLNEIEPARGGDRGNAATGGRSPIASRKAAADATSIRRPAQKDASRCQRARDQC